MTSARRAPPFRAGGTVGLLALALLFASTGCTKSVLYTYVSVHVMIDDTTVTEDQLVQVTSCVFDVASTEGSQSRNLRCPPHNVRFDVGTFEWETQVQQGDLAFMVRIFDSNLVVIGQGSSEPVPISPGKHLTTSVLVVGVQSPTPDGGTMSDAATTDGGDAATARDGNVDGADDAVGTDAAVDRASDGATTDLAPDSPVSDGAANDLTTGDMAGDMAGDGGVAGDAPTEARPPSDAGLDGQSRDSSDATPDGNSDGVEAG